MNTILNLTEFEDYLQYIVCIYIYNVYITL